MKLLNFMHPVSMRFYLIIIIFLAKVYSNAQSDYKTLIIDTIVTPKNSYYVQEQNQIFNFKERIPDSNYVFNKNNHPNYIGRFNCMKDSSFLLIPHDTLGSYIEIKNVGLLNTDTLRINKIVVSNNCLNDSLFKIETHWIELDTGLVDPPIDQIRERKLIDRSCLDSDNSDKLQLTINGKNYLISLTIENDLTEYKHYHGRYKKRFNLKTDGIKGKKSVYFSGREFLTHYILYGEIEIK